MRNRPTKGKQGRNQLGSFEPLLSLGSSIIAEPISGLAGLAALPFGADVASNAISGVQDSLTYQPRTEDGQAAMQSLTSALAPVGEAFTGASKFLGDKTYDVTGSPSLAAAAYSVPTLALEAVGLKGARSLNTGKALEFGGIGTQASSIGGKQRGAVGGITPKKQAAIDELKKRGYSNSSTLSKTPSDTAMGEGSMGDFTRFSDKVAARREAKLSVFDMPTKGKAENIKYITDLADYTPQQLVNQMKVLDQTRIKQGGYLKESDDLNVFYKNDGTSQMIDPKTNKVVFDNDVEQTGRIIRDDILDMAASKKTQEQISSEYQARKKVDADNRAREETAQEGYKMQHTAPMRGDNPSGDDLTPVFDKDIYTGNAQRFFGTGASFDGKAINIIQSIKGKPEKSVIIYRAVPKSVKEINPSDWVTITREYAKQHMEGEKNFHVLSKKVKAKDIASDGNSIHEFGYDPGDNSKKLSDSLNSK